MVLLLLSIVGVVVGIFTAAETSISDSEALVLIGISLIGVAIRLGREKGKRK